MRALQRIHSGFPVHPGPGNGSCMSVTHRTHISKLHPAPTAFNVRTDRQTNARHTKCSAPLRPLPLAHPALEAHCRGAPGPSRAACARSVDSIASRVSATAQTIAGSSRRLSAFERGLQVDLEHSAPTSSTSSPIVMVAPSPSRRYHLVLMRTQPVRAPPAGSGKAASQRGEQKRSIVQRRSALSTAPWSVIVCAISTGGVCSRAEGALTAIEPSFPAH